VGAPPQSQSKARVARECRSPIATVADRPGGPRGAMDSGCLPSHCQLCRVVCLRRGRSTGRRDSHWHTRLQEQPLRVGWLPLTGPATASERPLNLAEVQLFHQQPQARSESVPLTASVSDTLAKVRLPAGTSASGRVARSRPAAFRFLGEFVEFPIAIWEPVVVAQQSAFPDPQAFLLRSASPRYLTKSSLSARNFRNCIVVIF
jgi:hypothetical protein